MGKDGTVSRRLDVLLSTGAISRLTDDQLLERYATGRAEVAEIAFEALVDRHGAMVLRVCQSLLADPDEAQDAFQATFLILVRKAGTLWVRDSLGPWLHRVALHCASCARASRARRRRHEYRAAELATSRLSGDEGLDSPDLEWEQCLHEEIERLPERYRVPIVLCDLQGHSCEEVARRMGRPVGTVKCWRSRGRTRLRDRLIRRGLVPTAVLGSALASDVTRAAILEPIARATVRAMSGRLTAGTVPGSVQVLVKGVVKTMLFGKLRALSAAIIAFSFLAAGAGAVVWGTGRGPEGDDQVKLPGRTIEPRQTGSGSAPAKGQGGSWELSLREAIQLGLNNSGSLRVTSLPGSDMPFRVIPLNGVEDVPRLRGELMAHVRSIEQQYWDLYHQTSRVRSAEEAVGKAREVLAREEGELKAGRGTVADVAEANQRLEQLNLDLVTTNSDVITAERQLRNILGLPPDVGGRMVPYTPPIEARLVPDWDRCMEAMVNRQPDLVRAKSTVKEAQADTSPSGLARLEREKSNLGQIFGQATHSLARFFLEIDANYKQLQTAARSRDASRKRLEAQRAYYQEGRITIDRLLDAVCQHAHAVAQEAQFKAAYNVSIIALEEAKGTLLEYDKITLVVGADQVGASDTVRDFMAKFITRGKMASARTAPSAPPTPSLPAPVPPSPAVRPPAGGPIARDVIANTDPDSTTYSFQLTIGVGPKPIEIRGSFTVSPPRPADIPKAR